MSTPGQQKGEAEPKPNPYKPDLDEVADKFRNPPTGNPEDSSSSGGLVDKVSQHIPAVGKVLGKEEPQQQSAAEQKKPHPSVPPQRPHHDTQIEEFVRDNHRSRPEDQMVEE